jgi:aarF domain-containing kinase
MQQTYKLSPGAAILSAIDYKLTMAKSYKSVGEETEAYSMCHTQSAQRVLRALLANGGLLLFNKSTNSCDVLQVFSLKWDNIWLHCWFCRLSGEIP